MHMSDFVSSDCPSIDMGMSCQPAAATGCDSSVLGPVWERILRCVLVSTCSEPFRLGTGWYSLPLVRYGSICSLQWTNLICLSDAVPRASGISIAGSGVPGPATARAGG